MKNCRQKWFWLKILNFFFFFGCVYIYNLSNKKCVYIIKKRTYVYICVCGSCLNKYISVATWPSKQKFLTPPLFMLHHRPACIISANDIILEWRHFLMNEQQQTLALWDSYSILLCDLLLKKHTDIELFLYNEIKVTNTDTT